MKQIFIFLLICLSYISYAQIEIPAPIENEIIIRHTGHTISYNIQTHNANWSAWKLTLNNISKEIPRSSQFYPDKSLPKIHQVLPSEYINTGYDRGHLCPAADMTYNAQAMHDCFLMTNISPQNPTLNRSTWKTLEELCRKWTKSKDTLYIICGPVYNTDEKKTNKTIGDHKIKIPDGYFKVILSLNPKNAIGFYFPNSPSQHLKYSMTTVDHIEQITNINFFPSLPDDLENQLEKSFDPNLWR